METVAEIKLSPSEKWTLQKVAEASCPGSAPAAGVRAALQLVAEPAAEFVAITEPAPRSRVGGSP
jgi:hypothetical protein